MMTWPLFYLKLEYLQKIKIIQESPNTIYIIVSLKSSICEENINSRFM